MQNCKPYMIAAGGAGKPGGQSLGTLSHTVFFSRSPSCFSQFRGSLCIQRMGGGREGRNWVAYSSRSFLKNLTFGSVVLFEVPSFIWGNGSFRRHCKWPKWVRVMGWEGWEENSSHVATAVYVTTIYKCSVLPNVGHFAFNPYGR